MPGTTCRTLLPDNVPPCSSPPARRAAPSRPAAQFDYLARDSMYCGVKIGCDFNRIIQIKV